jgi:hypothetical protein
MKTIVFILGLTMAALAQQPQPSVPPTATHIIGGHHMGETFNEWLQINKISVESECKKSSPQYCALLAQIRDTGTGDLGSLLETQWQFHDGHLDGVMLNRDLGPGHSVKTELELLKQAYGKPDLYDDDRGLGHASALWSLPDGTMITAGEIGAMDAVLKHVLSVNFSNHRYKKPESVPAFNPYK